MRHPEPILSATEHRRLVGTLSLLGSDKPGERDAAALAATRMLRSRGLQWDAVIQAPALPVPKQPSPSSVQGHLDLCGRHLHRLERWPHAFVASLIAHPNRRLSARQREKLAEIADALRSRGLV